MAKRKWSEKEIEEYRNARGQLFYFNKEDSKLFVPKTYGFGWTLNFANPISWVIILAIVVLVVWRKQ